MNWLVLSLVTMVCWGFWGLLTKLASNHLQWYQVFITTNIVSILTSFLLYLHLRPPINVQSPGFLHAILAGAAGSIALLAFYTALAGGKAAIIVPLTALYPIVTIVLSHLLLHERTTLSQSIGIVLAIISILLVSIK